MKLCLAQNKPLTGDIQANIAHHQKLIDLAVTNHASMVVFPELSLTGYEPTLAEDLATTPEDNRFGVFQTISNAQNLTIGIGLPIKTAAGITISLLLFGPGAARTLYSKQYLHPDEEPFFISGQNKEGFVGQKKEIALAICYELSVPAHAERACHAGAGVYLASVAKSVQGLDKAKERLSQIAKDYAMMVGMVNCLGINDGMLCGGRSSAWNSRGELIGQLDERREGVLLLDTETEAVTELYH